VNRLAYLTTFVPFIERVIPKEWISPMALQNTVESHMNETNNSSSSHNNINNSSQALGGAGGVSATERLTDNNNRINNNNGIWSAIFNNIEKLEQNK